MSVLIVGGDRAGTYREQLAALGFDSAAHWSRLPKPYKWRERLISFKQIRLCRTIVRLVPLFWQTLSLVLGVVLC